MRQTTPIGEGKRAMRLNQLQEQIGRGEYQIDTLAVADAIVRRLIEVLNVTNLENKGSQGECS
jgi:anti-sigma28 factor (negative regulator of flagellin synthesis)